MQPTPLCPITGVPASRRIQSISASLIIGLWRWSFGVATDHQFGNIGHFGLWESPCGLAFFEPMLTGDEAFYLELYRRGDFHRVLNASSLARAEFRYVAEIVRTGETVLDVGCGEGGLARHLRHATYVGLDPHSYTVGTQPDIRNETISQHVATIGGRESLAGCHLAFARPLLILASRFSKECAQSARGRQRYSNLAIRWRSSGPLARRRL